jgi:hypothetical protein
MGLENVWHVFSWIVAFCFSPLIVSAMITSNPFWTKKPHEGYYARITRELKSKSSPRRYPFKVQLWLMALMYLVVSAMLVVPVYLTHHNGGTNDGWNVDPVPLIFAVLAVATTNLWLFIYLTTSGKRCSNVGIVQIIAIICSFMSLFFMLPRHSAWWSLGFIAYNIFWAVKLYLEDYYRCPDSPIACKQDSEAY